MLLLFLFKFFFFYLCVKGRRKKNINSLNFKKLMIVVFVVEIRVVIYKVIIRFHSFFFSISLFPSIILYKQLSARKKYYFYKIKLLKVAINHLIFLFFFLLKTDVFFKQNIANCNLRKKERKEDGIN